MPGYPKNITSNNSGGIVDNYTIDGLVPITYSINATDNEYNNLNDFIALYVVKATAVSLYEIYGTGENIDVIGQYWDRLENVTINMTNSTGDVVYSNELMASSTGVITDSISAPAPNGYSEVFDITIYKPGDDLDYVTYNLTVMLKAFVTTDKPKYQQDEIIKITGSYFTATIWICYCCFNSANISIISNISTYVYYFC